MALGIWGDVQEFTARAADVNCVGDINRAFGTMVHAWGFENFAAVQVSSRQTDLRAPFARSFGRPPVLWLDRYREAGHIHRDIGIARIMASTEPFWWSDLQSGYLDHQQRLIFGEASEFGLRQGLVIPVRQADGSVWSCLLSAQHVSESHEMKLAAVVAANYYVGRGALLQSRQSRQIDLAHRLTHRQKEVILWLARGKTAAEIGDILGTSGRTVAHQLDDAKKRLNCRTLSSLVAEAIVHGEIVL